MSGLSFNIRGRTFLTGKVIFNFGQSTIDCVVRRITDDGASIELESGLGVPEHFQLSIASERALLPCKLVWQSEKQLGVTFETRQTADATARRESVGRSRRRPWTPQPDACAARGA